MRAWVVFFLFFAVLIGYVDQPPAQASDKSATLSPIADFDKTRLWILAQASPVSDGRKCTRYYRAPQDPRYRGYARECEAWSLDFTDYLRVNGLPTLEPRHVRELIYWDWFDATRAAIADCKEKVSARKIPPRDGQARRQRNYDSNACDPYQHEMWNNRTTHKKLGIVFPRRY